MLSTLACQAARDIAGCVSTIPAEWQERQLLLIASAAAPPGNVRSLARNSRLIECSVIPPAATEDGDDAAVPVLASAAAAARAGGLPLGRPCVPPENRTTPATTPDTYAMAVRDRGIR